MRACIKCPIDNRELRVEWPLVVCLKSLQLWRCFEALAEFSTRFGYGCANPVRNMAHTDCTAVSRLLPRAVRWLYGILGTNWSGANKLGAFRLMDPNLRNLRVRHSS